MRRTLVCFLRSSVLAGSLLTCAAPAWAHQGVDPAILRLIKPRTGPAPGNIVRPAGNSFVERGRRLFFNETFNGNGRTCGTCHRAERNFTIDAAFIRRLPASDPLFVGERIGIENPVLLRTRGLILENLDGFLQPNGLPQPGVLRGVPHTLGLRVSSGPAVDAGNVPLPLEGALGWSGDGAPGDGTLVQFAVGAVIQHFTKSLAREVGTDFRLPTENELNDLLAFQRSLGRQGEINVTPPDPANPQNPPALTFPDTAVTAGQRLFHGLDGAGRSCAFCHNNAGANGATGNGRNFDTGVRKLDHEPGFADAPACTDPKVPVDGGFGTNKNFPVEMIPLCGQSHPSVGNGEFNTPSVIEAADTPPFFHNNSAATIEDAVRFYTTNTFRGSPAGRAGAFVLNPTQVNQVAAFLRTINALGNIASASLSLKGASGRPSLLNILKDPAVRDINDAIKVLTQGPIRLFAATVRLLVAANVDIARGRLTSAQMDLAQARSLMVTP